MNNSSSTTPTTLRRGALLAPKAAGWPRLMFGGTTRAAADLGDGGKGRFGVAGACDLGRGPAADATLQTAVTKTCDPLDAAE